MPKRARAKTAAAFSCFLLLVTVLGRFFCLGPISAAPLILCPADLEPIGSNRMTSFACIAVCVSVRVPCLRAVGRKVDFSPAAPGPAQRERFPARRTLQAALDVSYDAYLFHLLLQALPVDPQLPGGCAHVPRMGFQRGLNCQTFEALYQLALGFAQGKF